MSLTVEGPPSSAFKRKSSTVILAPLCNEMQRNTSVARVPVKSAEFQTETSPDLIASVEFSPASPVVGNCQLLRHFGRKPARREAVMAKQGGVAKHRPAQTLNVVNFPVYVHRSASRPRTTSLEGRYLFGIALTAQ
jgi:hypothetical protein